MLDEIANIPIISRKVVPKKKQQRKKYTKSNALRNVYRAKVRSHNKKRGK